MGTLSTNRTTWDGTVRFFRRWPQEFLQAGSRQTNRSMSLACGIISFIEFICGGIIYGGRANVLLRRGILVATGPTCHKRPTAERQAGLETETGSAADESAVSVDSMVRVAVSTAWGREKQTCRPIRPCHGRSPCQASSWNSEADLGHPDRTVPGYRFFRLSVFRAIGFSGLLDPSLELFANFN